MEMSALKERGSSLDARTKDLDVDKDREGSSGEGMLTLRAVGRRS